MSKGFSPEVKQALKNIYYDTAAQRGAEGFSLLEKASAAGDGDATCILARCLCGRQYVWPVMVFQKMMTAQPASCTNPWNREARSAC